MHYLPFQNKYDKFPKKRVDGYNFDVFNSFDEIVSELSKYHEGVLAIEAYPGTDLKLIMDNIIPRLSSSISINIETCKLPFVMLDHRFSGLLTDDRVFGKMGYATIEDFYNLDQIESIKDLINSTTGLRIVYGFGATLINYDYLVYFDITRWDIQLKFRKGLPNFTADNPQEDVLKKFKRGYFLEWRVADKIKNQHFLKSNYMITEDSINKLVMVTNKAFQAGLDHLSHSPFRLIPYFDPGIWGGQWMKEVCGLPKDKPNYAWSFDGVPEENALAIDYGKAVFIFPAINLVFFRTVELLGEKVYGRFGKEFPIRFDFLDTMEGGNLSLQVHPTTEYIQRNFGMNYTQDESYYIMDASPESVVYLGLKKDIDKDKFINDLEKSNSGAQVFDDTQFINSIPVKKHDHLLIPAGTIHCSGKNTMVLEISATPYIFTFKLWDWGRLGLDGLPRPIHLSHGKEVIDFSRDSQWVNEHLYNQFTRINDNEIKTGLHEREFIETRRLSIDSAIETSTEKSVNVLNLVEGEQAQIESIDHSFSPFIVHYAETFIIPECIGKYVIRNISSSPTIMVIKAFVR